MSACSKMPEYPCKHRSGYFAKKPLRSCLRAQREDEVDGCFLECLPSGEQCRSWASQRQIQREVLLCYHCSYCHHHGINSALWSIVDSALDSGRLRAVFFCATMKRQIHCVMTSHVRKEQKEFCALSVRTDGTFMQRSVASKCPP